jgi:hypothetical protein
MTDEEIHNIYLHMSGKAEGLVEATGTADFPVLFARAILDYEGLTKDVQNMASKSTYKEQLETKDEPVAWGMEKDGVILDVICPAEHERLEGAYIIPLYAHPKEWVGLTDEEIENIYMETMNFQQNARALEAKIKDKNT